MTNARRELCRTVCPEPVEGVEVRSMADIGTGGRGRLVTNAVFSRLYSKMGPIVQKARGGGRRPPAGNRGKGRLNVER